MCLRRLRISDRQPTHQLIRRDIEKVYFAAGPKLLRSRPIVFAFRLRPEAEIEDDIRSQFKRPACDVPKHRFNETVPSIMFWLLSILTEKPYVPFIGCQAKGRLLMLKLLRKRGFARARKSNHQMEGRHSYYSWSWWRYRCSGESGWDQHITDTSVYAYHYLFITSADCAAVPCACSPANPAVKNAVTRWQ